jgi:hypothetical protein
MQSYPEDAELQQAFATIYVARGSLRRTRGNLKSARTDLEAALHIQQAFADANPTDLKALFAVAWTSGNLAPIAVAAGDDSAAIGYFRRSIQIREGLIQLGSYDDGLYTLAAAPQTRDLFLLSGKKQTWPSRISPRSR